MGFIDGFFNFLKDKTLSFSKKSLILFGFLLFLFFIDLFFGFSFNYGINQRLTQIEKIENLKQNYCLNDTLLNELNKIENRLISRFDYFKLIHLREKRSKIDSVIEMDTLLVTIKDSISLLDTAINENVYNNVDTLLILVDSSLIYMENELEKEKVHKEKKAQLRNWKWDLISSTYLYILVIVLLLIVPFTMSSNFIEVMFGALILIACVVLFGWMSYKTFISIPIIWKPWINYTINAILHLVTSTSLGFIVYKAYDKKK